MLMISCCGFAWLTRDNSCTSQVRNASSPRLEQQAGNSIMGENNTTWHKHLCLQQYFFACYTVTHNSAQGLPIHTGCSSCLLLYITAYVCVCVCVHTHTCTHTHNTTHTLIIIMRYEEPIHTSLTNTQRVRPYTTPSPCTQRCTLHQNTKHTHTSRHASMARACPQGHVLHSPEKALLDLA